MLEGQLRAKEVFKDPPASLPYQERIGHRLARDQETFTGRNLDGQCQGGPEGEKSTDEIKEDLESRLYFAG